MKSKILQSICIIFLSAIMSNANAQSSHSFHADNKYSKELKKLKKRLQKKGYKIGPLLKDKKFKIYDNIGDHFRNSAERTTPDLAQYKNLLHFHKKISRGVQFFQNHKKTLKKAARKYDISPYLIAAIIGIESNFGQNAGSYNPFNVYVSMIAVGYRKHFARSQLEQLLDFVNRTGLGIFSLKSSYAGAISYAQFIPYSLNKWFVGDNIFDMHDNIMSVGNYLAHFKRKTGSVRKAVLHYNSSKLYQGFVLDLADAIQKEYMAQQQSG